MMNFIFQNSQSLCKTSRTNTILDTRKKSSSVNSRDRVSKNLITATGSLAKLKTKFHTFIFCMETFLQVFMENLKSRTIGIIGNGSIKTLDKNLDN